MGGQKKVTGIEEWKGLRGKVWGQWGIREEMGSAGKNRRENEGWRLGEKPGKNWREPGREMM